MTAQLFHLFSYSRPNRLIAHGLLRTHQTIGGSPQAQKAGPQMSTVWSGYAVFEPETREKAGGKPRLLIADGHDSPITSNFIAHCMENNIDLLILPPHNSHVLHHLIFRFSAHLRPRMQLRQIYSHAPELYVYRNKNGLIYIRERERRLLPRRTLRAHGVALV